MIKDSTLLRWERGIEISAGGVVWSRLIYRPPWVLSSSVLSTSTRRFDEPNVNESLAHIRNDIDTSANKHISPTISPRFNRVRSRVHVGTIQSVNFLGNRSTGTRRPEEDCERDSSTRPVDALPAAVASIVVNWIAVKTEAAGTTLQ